MKLAGTKRKWDDAESPIRAQKTSEDVRLSRKKARVDTSGKIEAGVIQAVASSEDVKPSKMCFTDVDSLEDDRVGNNAYSLLGDEYIEYSVSLAGSENSILVSDMLVMLCTADRFVGRFLRFSYDPVDAARQVPYCHRPHRDPHSNKEWPRLSGGTWSKKEILDSHERRCTVCGELEGVRVGQTPRD